MEHKTETDGSRGAVERYRDEYGRRVAKVLLACGAFATIEAGDFDRLLREGVSPAWYVNSNGNGRAYVRAAANTRGGQITIARAVLGLGSGEVVRYVSGDRLDLRHSNLQAKRGKAKRNDLSLVMGAA